MDVKVTSPSPAPCTVTEAEPVPAWLMFLTVDVVCKSYVMIAVVVPIRSPPVMLMCWVDACDGCVLQTKADSFSHEVISLVVRPICSCIVSACAEMNCPYTVKLVDPVEPVFL